MVDHVRPLLGFEVAVERRPELVPHVTVNLALEAGLLVFLP
jgi:hypothetical protein